MTVLDPETGEEVPADGETMGEIVFRGNVVMKGYLKNPAATQEAFAGGWFHSGDLAVREPDGYVKIKDRAKDVIISGGENISSVEVEDVLYQHPAVAFRRRRRDPDPKWGETPARVRRAEGRRDGHRARARRALPRAPGALQGATQRRLRCAAQDEHGEDPEERPARERTIRRVVPVRCA